VGSIRVDCTAAGLSRGAYTLTVTPASIVVVAGGPEVAAYGVATLAQLLRWDTSLQTHVAEVVPLAVDDAPAFAWRGVMVDTSRHFVPVATLLQTLDGMYAAKLNVFHWHIVDSPSFGYHSERHPELAREGSWSGVCAKDYFNLRRPVMSILNTIHLVQSCSTQPPLVQPCSIQPHLIQLCTTQPTQKGD